MVRAHNREGYIDSDYLKIINSGYPLPVTSAIVLIERNETSIKV